MLKHCDADTPSGVFETPLESTKNDDEQRTSERLEEQTLSTIHGAEVADSGTSTASASPNHNTRQASTPAPPVLASTSALGMVQ